MNPPAVLKPLVRILKTADQIQKHEPVVAWCCTPFSALLRISITLAHTPRRRTLTDKSNFTRMSPGRHYAVELGMELRAGSNDPAIMKFLSELLDVIEDVRAHYRVFFLT